jgi:hypothetical protein
MISFTVDLVPLLLFLFDLQIQEHMSSSLAFIIKSSSDRRNEENHLLGRIIAKENFVRGLLLALEMESGNAILKMGVCMLFIEVS